MNRALSVGLGSSIVLFAIVQSGSTAGTPRIQNREALQKVYGNPVSEVYRISQNLTVTAEFATNGSLCYANIEGTEGGITDSELNAVIDQVAPDAVRGEHKLSTFLNMTCLKRVKPENSKSELKEKQPVNLDVDPCAECSGVSDDYEHAQITKLGNTNEYSSVRIKFKTRDCKRDLHGSFAQDGWR